MIPYQNCEVFASILFLILSRIVCFITNYFRVNSMYNRRQPTLTSIPEKNENDDEALRTKWVPKKKHEVLKAKYKCLKKLFQLYDASLIGMLPEQYAAETEQEAVPAPEPEPEPEPAPERHRRKKRSRRTKSDAEPQSGAAESDAGDASCPPATSLAGEFTKQLRTSPSYTSTQTQSNYQSESKSTLRPRNSHYASTQSTRTCEVETMSTAASGTACECTCTQTCTTPLSPQLQSQPPPPPHPLPYLMVNERRRPTRFQCFIHRILGIRREKPYKRHVSANGHVYAASDNNISHNFGNNERRRRRGLRFRRLRRPKKILSEGALRVARSPEILTCVQTVQRNCLLDTTPRQCPILGCSMMFYGIINYNDHLNLCHFTSKKFICHYCHEGFEQEYDKLVHENEHIGINKLGLKIPRAGSPEAGHTACCTRVSDTQTDPPAPTTPAVPDEKLKKIVSFFDKIVISDQLNKSRYSESNLYKMRTSSQNGDSCSGWGGRRAVSCSDTSGCAGCGQRRQLSLHVALDHRQSKLHSCAPQRKRIDLISEDGKIQVESHNSCSEVKRINTSSTLTQETCSELVRSKSDDSLSFEPSTNIIYYTSTETVTKKASVLSNLAQKVKSGISSYRWEPGTKIIHV